MQGGPSSLQVDERQMVARELSGSKTTSSSARPEEYGLQRQGSMNLPKPEDSGVPATHPDMCILRIRRNHLVEVRPVTCF